VLTARAALVLLPHYVALYRVRDEVVRLSRMPTEDDGVVRGEVERALRRHLADCRLAGSGIEVAGRDGRRLVRFAYSVRLELLPWLPAPVRFEVRVEEPYITQPKPLLL
jgi:hypothetical protein